MKNRIYSFIISGLLLIGCNQQPKGLHYEYLSIGDKYIEYIATGQYEDSLEVGLWTIKTKDNRSLSEGVFEKGLRKGTWKYWSDSIVSTVNWKIVDSRKNKNLVTNVPKELLTQEKDSFLIYAFDNVDTIKLNHFFYIRELSAKYYEITAKSYSDYIFGELNKDMNIESSKRYIITNNKKKIYLNISSKFSNNPTIYFHAALDIGDDVCEFYYKTTDMTFVSGVKFLDILQGTYINNKRVLNPIYPFKLQTNDEEKTN